MRQERGKLKRQGHEVVSSWLNEKKRPRGLPLKEWHFRLALKDVWELQSADLVLVDLFDVSTTGGRDTELGIALGCGIIVGTVGFVESVFHELADFQFRVWDEVHAWLRESQR